MPLDRMPLYLREGAVVPMGPVINYVEERPIDHLEVCVSLFTGDGRATLSVPVNGAMVELVYVAENGTHTLTVGSTDVRAQVEALGEGRLELVRR